jgi:phenolic acid decarboxylase
MNIAKCFLFASMGFFLGVVLLGFRVANVQAQPIGKAHVYIVSVQMPNADMAIARNLSGVRIAGISCIPKPTNKQPDAAVCYVATTLAGD